MDNARVSEYKTTLSAASIRYGDSLNFENGLLLSNWVARYERKTEEMANLARIRGIPDIKITRYINLRNSTFQARKDKYEKQLHDSIIPKVHAYVASLRAKFDF